MPAAIKFEVQMCQYPYKSFFFFLYFFIILNNEKLNFNQMYLMVSPSEALTIVF